MGEGGCLLCTSSDSEASHSRKIDRQLNKERKVLKRQVKILLLGSGESGKSTFLKQMTIIHGRGEFTADEVREYRQIIYQNVVIGMRVLIDARSKLAYPWQDPTRQATADIVFKLATSVDVRKSLDNRTFAGVAPQVADLWDDLAIQQTFEERNLFQISDSCKYFFENIKRLAQPDFMPTNRDILFCRKATRGINEHHFEIQHVPFRFIDVGGQRSQRQKWFQCFEGITSILFLCASNEFDQVVLEDRRTNRIVEARSIFETIVNNKNFVSVSIILFMNKSDLLAEKVPKSNITTYFPEFKGNTESVQDVQFFLLGLFESCRRERQLPFFYHFTTAVDTNNIRRVFQDCREIILEQNLRTLMMQ